MNNKFWTEEELSILHKYYPTEGWETVHNILKYRTRSAIQRQAAYKGLTYGGPIKNHKDTASVVPEEGLTEDQEKVLKFIGGTETTRKTIVEISDYLDRGPAYVGEVLKDLKDKHYNVQIEEREQLVTLLKFPPVGERKVINVEKYFGSSREVTFGIISDMHYCNVHSRESLIKLMYEICKKEGVSIVFQPGNMLDGEIFFNTRELLAWGVEGQINYLVNHVPQVEGIKTYFITGDDHEGWMAKKAGLNIGELIEHRMKEAGRDDWVYLSHMEADVEFRTKEGSAVVRITHPGGGSSYALSYAPQKTVESLTGGEKPHVLIEGHYHKSLYAMIRNIHTMLAGTFEAQTPFMRKKRIEAHVGGWVVRMSLGKDGTVLKFQPTWYPFLDRQVYSVNKDYPIQGFGLREDIEIKPAQSF